MFQTILRVLCPGLVGAGLVFVMAAAFAEEAGDGEAIRAAPASPASARAAFLADVCRRIERAALETRLPPAFLARLIWKESRFDPGAVSPKGAAGIAQFMPGTARLRGLDDPFDPRSAIPASAGYLADLAREFGNLGLAAAAYNAGPARVRRWRAGRTGLPRETQDFVLSITGYGPRDWNAPEQPKVDYVLDKSLSFLEACRQLPVRRFTPRLLYASAPWQPWGVQLTAAWSPTRALAHYARLQRQFPKVLDGVSPMVLRKVNRSWGTSPRFSIRIGQPDRRKADRFCQRLRRAGGACLVYKTARR